MMPKKQPKDKRNIIVGVKINEATNTKLKFLANYEKVPVSTYMFNLLNKHIEEKEPWLSKEINERQGKEVDK